MLTFLKRDLISIVILLVLAIVLTRSLHKAVDRQFFETTTRFTLEQKIDASEGSHLADVRFETVPGDKPPGTTIVRAVVRGPSAPSAAQVAAMESGLPRPPDGTNLELRIRFVKTTIINRDGLLYEDVKFGLTE